MIDNDGPFLDMENANIAEYLRLVGACEQTANQLDEDFKDKIKDGIHIGYLTGAEVGGDMMSDIQFMAAREYEKFRDESSGVEEYCEVYTYTFISRVKNFLPFYMLPSGIKEYIKTYRPEEWADPATTYSIQFEQVYALSDSQPDYHFEHDVTVCVDDEPISNLMDGEDKTTEVDTSDLADDEFVSLEDLKALFSEEDLNDLKALEKDLEGKPGDVDVIELYKNQISGLNFLSRAQHLQRINGLLEILRIETGLTLAVASE